MVYFGNSHKCKTRLGKLAYELLIFHLCRKYGIEIKTETKIGKGFCLLHPYNITVSPYAVIGDNVMMFKGSTVGLGKRVDGKSAPVIGKHVYIGLNSNIVGVTIGDDVLIAPNTLVNCDVPSHGVVIGSPCQIHHKENATGSVIWKYIP